MFYLCITMVEAFSFILICLVACITIILHDISQHIAEVKIALKDLVPVIDESGRGIKEAIISRRKHTYT